MSEELERIYKVSLGKAWVAPRNRRAIRAVGILKEFAKRHMKSEEIKISPELNEIIWENGIKRAPRKIEVKMIRDSDGIVTVQLPT